MGENRIGTGANHSSSHRLNTPEDYPVRTRTQPSRGFSNSELSEQTPVLRVLNPNLFAKRQKNMSKPFSRANVFPPILRHTQSYTLKLNGVAFGTFENKGG